MRDKNICWRCKNWDKCFVNRYYDNKQDYMKKTYKKKDDWGQDVIYVEECEKYEYEDPEVPKKAIIGIHNEEFEKIYDIIDAVENYFYDSGE